jgi:hypothetical protein
VIYSFSAFESTREVPSVDRGLGCFGVSCDREMLSARDTARTGRFEPTMAFAIAFRRLLSEFAASRVTASDKCWTILSATDFSGCSHPPMNWLTRRDRVRPATTACRSSGVSDMPTKSSTNPLTRRRCSLGEMVSPSLTDGGSTLRSGVGAPTDSRNRSMRVFFGALARAVELTDARSRSLRDIIYTYKTVRINCRQVGTVVELR